MPDDSFVLQLVILSQCEMHHNNLPSCVKLHYVTSSLEKTFGQSLWPWVENPRPWEISLSSRDVFPNTSLLSAVYGYNLV